jgi:hypothetical protein
MPYITSISIRVSRKFQIAKDDWLGVDALVTIAVHEDEADLVDPFEVRRLAREQAQAAVDEQIAEIVAERQQRQQQAKTISQLPTTPAEAEQRFYARYAERIGGSDWSAVQTFLQRKLSKPKTINDWLNIAKQVKG